MENDHDQAAVAGPARGVRSWLVPLLAGLVLDLADLVTFGPLALYFGLVVGTAVGWWLVGLHGIRQPSSRWLWAGVGGLYCMLPMTEWVPAATLVSAALVFRARRRALWAREAAD